MRTHSASFFPAGRRLAAVPRRIAAGRLAALGRLAAAALPAVAVLLASMAPAAPAAPPPRRQAEILVAKLRAADYAGDQAVMQAQFDALAPLAAQPDLAARMHYWRGFAQWRRAINGFNDNLPAAELERDLEQAVGEFRAAAAADSAFVDARVAELSALGYIMFLHREDLPKLREMAGQLSPLLMALRATAADNPRFLWVMGPILWQRPAEQGGGAAKAIENYERGLALIRGGTGISKDPLDPSWGEPELLMNLGWSHLNAPTPDLDAAERDARAALKLVPRWHYVKDILLKQIADARAAKK